VSTTVEPLDRELSPTVSVADGLRQTMTLS
jgi:hypothetical protein